MAGFAVAALAIAVRLAWVLLVPTKPVGDFAMYVESAAHVVAHGSLDPEFVYMPGYVFLLAAVQALGGGLLAMKVVGAVLGGWGAGLVYGITRRLWDLRGGLVAGVMCALWPAGIAVSSVTGTDMPAGILIVAAVSCLVRWGTAGRAPTEPGEPAPRSAVLASWVGPLAFGAVMGLAAYVRAVALPLTVMGAFFLRASGLPWRDVARRTAVAVAAAAAVLSPWMVRNHARYGEWFATDSHGGLTALVGANPNSEGTYSRSLNLIFHQVTGYKLLAEPHRAADRASYDLARDWTAYEPAYSLGLIVAKTERLLANERPLLYWPLYRAGVLRESRRAWFDQYRRQIETAVDVFWAGLVAAAALGLAVAAARKRWVALAIIPFILSLTGIYALFFAEARYHLPVALLMFPAAGIGIAWLVAAVWGLVRRTARPGLWREAIAGAACVLVVFVGWPSLLYAGARLRQRYRFAVHVCQIGAETRACKWRAVAVPGSPPPDGGVRGIYDGVGIAVPARQGQARAAEAQIPVAAGRYRVHAEMDVSPTPAADAAPAGAVEVRAAGVSLLKMDLGEVATATRQGATVIIEGIVEATGKTLPLLLVVDGPPATATAAASPPVGGAGPAPPRVWLTDLRVSPVGP